MAGRGAQPLSHKACDDVGCAAGRKADDDAHRPRRIGLRPRYARYSRERGSTRGQMEKLSTGKSHFEPPSLVPLFDHLVGAGEQRRGEGEGERPCRLQVDQELKLGGLINRNVTGLGTFEDFVHVIGHAPE
jgi:hypothetical protein